MLDSRRRAIENCELMDDISEAVQLVIVRCASPDDCYVDGSCDGHASRKDDTLDLAAPNGCGRFAIIKKFSGSRLPICWILGATMH